MRPQKRRTLSARPTSKYADYKPWRDGRNPYSHMWRPHETSSFASQQLRLDTSMLPSLRFAASNSKMSANPRKVFAKVSGFFTLLHYPFQDRKPSFQAFSELLKKGDLLLLLPWSKGYPTKMSLNRLHRSSRHPIPQVVAGRAVEFGGHSRRSRSRAAWRRRGGRRSGSSNLVQAYNLLTAQRAVHKPLHTWQTKRCVAARLCAITLFC